MKSSLFLLSAAAAVALLLQFLNAVVGSTKCPGVHERRDPGKHRLCQRACPPAHHTEPCQNGVRCVCVHGYIRSTHRADSPCVRHDECLSPDASGLTEAEMASANCSAEAHERPKLYTGASWRWLCDTGVALCGPPPICPRGGAAVETVELNPFRHVGCECAEGYARKTHSLEARCVRLDECPPPPWEHHSSEDEEAKKCPRNERYDKCARRCEPTCARPKPPCWPTKEACRARCKCQRGFVRIERGGRCVRLAECPQVGPRQQQND